MTLSANTCVSEYGVIPGNTVKVFNFPIYTLSSAHVLMLADGVAINPADYTVSNVGTSQTTITFGVAPDDVMLKFVRRLPVTQLTDYIDNDAFPAESHENALDYLTMIATSLRYVLVSDVCRYIAWGTGDGSATVFAKPSALEEYFTDSSIVFVDGLAVAPSTFTIDETAQDITFTAAPALGAVITVNAYIRAEIYI